MSMARLVIPQPTFFHDAAEMSVSCEKKGTVKTDESVLVVLVVRFATTFFGVLVDCDLVSILTGVVEAISGMGVETVSVVPASASAWSTLKVVGCESSKPSDAVAPEVKANSEKNRRYFKVPTVYLR
jgi:hypothetical protein